MSDNGLALARTLYPRVSTILRDMGLAKPYPDLPAVEWGRARGTAVHKAIQLYEQGALDETCLHPDIAGPFKAYQAFRGDTGYHPEAFEERVCHDGLRFRGTLDSRGACHRLSGLTPGGSCRVRPNTIDGPCILDFKCSKQPQLDAAAYQLGAYALALEPEQFHDERRPFPPRYVIQLGDEGYRIHDVSSDKAIEIFACASRVWWAQREGFGL